MTTEATEVPDTVETPETTDPVTGSTQDVPAATATDDAEAALAIIRAARADSAPTDTKKAEAPPTEPPAKTPDVPPPAADPKAADLLARLTASEAEARRLRDQVKAAGEAAKRAAELADLEKDPDPKRIFSRFGLTPEAVLDYVENGDKAKLPGELRKEQRLGTAEHRIAQLEQELRQRDARAVVDNYKASVAAEITKRSADFKHLVAFHGSAETAAAQIFDVQNAAYREGREIDFDTAAGQLEASLRTVLQRLGGAAASGEGKPVTEPAKITPASATKQPAPRKVVTPDDDVSDPHEKAALAIIRQARAAAGS